MSGIKLRKHKLTVSTKSMHNDEQLLILHATAEQVNEKKKGNHIQMNLCKTCTSIAHSILRSFGKHLLQK